MKDTIKAGDSVRINPSQALDEMRLTEIAGRKALVLETLTSPTRKNKGYMVKLSYGEYLGEKIWFIPAESIHRE